jgi:hypothetical protein
VKEITNHIWHQTPSTIKNGQLHGTVPQQVKKVRSVNPLTPNDLQRCRAVIPLKIKIPSKNMREKPTNTPIIHSVYKLCMVASTCFGITLPTSGSVPSAF